MSMTTREQFEQAIKARFGDSIDYRVCKNSDGEYMVWDMQVAWWAWQSASTAANATIHNLELKVERVVAENATTSGNDLYIALRTESDIDTLNDKHLTICYMSATETSKLDVNRILPNCVEASISAIAYWERVNLTVALIDSPDTHMAYKASMMSGFTYDLEFIPHITLGSGDSTIEHENLVGKTIRLGNPYIRLKKSKSKTTATDAYLAEIRAQGVEMFADSMAQHLAVLKGNGDAAMTQIQVGTAERLALAFAAQLRQGAENE